MLKPYNELVKVDVSKQCKERDKIKYLPWVACVELLHENGAEKVYFEPMVTEKGSSLFMSDVEFLDKNGVANRCYEVRIKIVIDDLEIEYQTPVMNGANPVKDNSMSQQRVWNSQTRAFVKGVAIHTGLGFQLWTGDEDFPDDTEDLYKHSILAIKERVQQLITTKMDGGLSKFDICGGIGIDEEQLETFMKRYDALDRFEKAIQKL